MRAQVKEGSVTKDRGKRPVPRTDISSALPRPRRAHREPTHARAVDARARRIDALPPAHHGTRRFARARAPKRGVRAARRARPRLRFWEAHRAERALRPSAMSSDAFLARRVVRRARPGASRARFPRGESSRPRPGLAIRPEPDRAPGRGLRRGQSSREIARGSFAPTPPSIDAQLFFPSPRLASPPRRPSRRRRRSASISSPRRHRLADEGARLLYEEPDKPATASISSRRTSAGPPRGSLRR